MHFISFVVSERKNGNCDLLGRLAAKYAKESGADSSEIIYLKNYDIEQCRGCLHCVLEKKKCKINDDLYQLLDDIKKADRLLLVAPVYVLSVPGKLKLLLDRFLCTYSYLKDSYGIPATSIGVAALNDWHQFQLPLMNLFLLSFGCHIVDSFIIYGAGPGEVLLEKRTDELQKSVQKLLGYRKTAFQSHISKHCPVDFSTLFERIEGINYRCPVCLTPAKEVDDGYFFQAKDLNNHRWTIQKIQNHFINWILKTKPRFKLKLREIVHKRKKFGI
jgi:multimeric flavodoxin WrbA